MKTFRLRPSQVRGNPDRCNHDHPTTVRFPLGEVDTVKLPLVLLGLKNSLRICGIESTDQWNAQGLEGAGEIKTTWCKAYVLMVKLADGRGTAIIRK